MKRLAVKIPLSLEIQQVSAYILDEEGVCNCGRVLRKMDAKLTLMSPRASFGYVEVAAYCLPCSKRINDLIASLGSVIHDTRTVKAPTNLPLLKG